MPWGAYARMTDDDLRSVFRYLRSVPAARGTRWKIEYDTGPAMQLK